MALIFRAELGGAVMIKKVAIGGLFTAVLLSSSSLGQQDELQKVFAYATYFVCSPDRESRADEIISSSFKPHYDLAVEQGEILSWSWQSHFGGGNWRRALVIIAADMDSIIDASGALGEAISESTPEAGRAFSGICASHEDYVWEMDVAVGSAAAVDDRGEAGFSVYMQCDLSREDRADELMGDVIGPI